MEIQLIAAIALVLLLIIVLAKTAVVVPQQSAYVVERLGQLQRHAGRRLPHPGAVHGRDPLPALAEGNRRSTSRSRSASRATTCRCGVDGVLYLKVLNPERASYGISDYLFAITQLAQTTLRSEVGKIELDRTFEERTNINIVGRRRARQGVRAVGREGAALRDQEHHAAAGHPRGDGEADARRAREARRRS